MNERLETIRQIMSDFLNETYSKCYVIAEKEDQVTKDDEYYIELGQLQEVLFSQKEVKQRRELAHLFQVYMMRYNISEVDEKQFYDMLYSKKEKN